MSKKNNLKYIKPTSHKHSKTLFVENEHKRDKHTFNSDDLIQIEKFVKEFYHKHHKIMTKLAYE